MIDRDTIIKLAREAGMRIAIESVDDLPEVWSVTSTPELERFAALVAAAEREACAKVCDSLASPSRLSDPSRSWITGTLDCASAIRARSST